MSREFLSHHPVVCSLVNLLKNTLFPSFSSFHLPPSPLLPPISYSSFSYIRCMCIIPEGRKHGVDVLSSAIVECATRSGACVALGIPRDLKRLSEKAFSSAAHERFTPLLPPPPLPLPLPSPSPRLPPPPTRHYCSCFPLCPTYTLLLSSLSL